MIKSLLIYVVSFAALFFVVLFLQDQILTQNGLSVRFSFYDTNVFFAVISAVICIHLKVFSTINKLQPQLGYIYLPTLFIKGGLFYLMFRTTVFSIENLSITERASLLIPLFIFLILEVFFIIKILNQNNLKILE